jgi:hypothetical protein
MHPRIAHQFLFSTTEVHPARLIKTFTVQGTQPIASVWRGWSNLMHKYGLLQTRRTQKTLRHL